MLKQETQSKVDAAIKACNEVQASWNAAYSALGGNVKTNGFGIYSDRVELRNKLLIAQSQLATALQTIDGIDWPTSDDYDKL